MGIFGRFHKKEKKPEESQAISYETLRKNIMKGHDLKTDHRMVLDEYLEASRDKPDTPDKLYCLGVLQHDIASTIRDVEEDDVFYYYVDAAISNLEKVIRMKPDYEYMAYPLLMNSYSKRGNLAALVSTANRFIKAFPENRHIALAFIKVAVSPRFPLTASGGMCDVCGKPLQPDSAFQIPVDVFYSSPKYRDWYSQNMMPKLRASGAPSNLTVDMVLADMRSKDQTLYSVVCEECVEFFL
jgi:hypothetical protein